MLSTEEIHEFCNEFLVHVNVYTEINDYSALKKEYKNWYVGITAAPEDRHKQHLRKKTYLVNHFYHQNLNSLSDAKKIEKMLYDAGFARYFAELDERLELDSLKAASTFVYIFKFK